MKNIEKQLSSLNFFEDIDKLLYTELYIDFKKEKGIKLTPKELFFDKYLVKPSFMLKLLTKEVKKREKH